jgi:hypothetical protein
MSHFIQGLVATTTILTTRSLLLPPSVTLAPLACAYGLVLADQINLREMPDQLADVGQELSHAGAVAYVSTEYSGAEGAQSAAFWRNGALVYAPKWSKSSVINEALREIGVMRTIEYDEFDTWQRSGSTVIRRPLLL